MAKFMVLSMERRNGELEQVLVSQDEWEDSGESARDFFVRPVEEARVDGEVEIHDARNILLGGVFKRVS